MMVSDLEFNDFILIGIGLEHISSDNKTNSY